MPSPADRPRAGIPRVAAIGTAVPGITLTQDAVRDIFVREAAGDRRAERIVRTVFDASDIDTRHTVLADLAATDPSGDFVGPGGIAWPSTATRNAVYAAEAPPLFAAAARDALSQAAVDPDQVTHVVTVSCTGFFAPGPEFRLVRDLGLPDATQRYHLGFQGCGAALPALGLADQLCRADPAAVVLVVCAELCTLHIQPSVAPEQIVSSAVFGDGAAAAVVVGGAVEVPGRTLEIEAFATAIAADGERDMRWVIGDHGFEMTLTAAVPRIVGREARGALAAHDIDARPVRAWAVHPGGRSILDRVEAALDLPASALGPSRDVLRSHGNMSSATVLFVLREIFDDAGLDDDDRVLAAAFGPGLTIESGAFAVRTPR